MNNEYDNEVFFSEYAKMSRSREGLSAAGEWHQLKPLFSAASGENGFGFRLRLWLALHVCGRTGSCKGIGAGLEQEND